LRDPLHSALAGAGWAAEELRNVPSVDRENSRVTGESTCRRRSFTDRPGQASRSLVRAWPHVSAGFAGASKHRELVTTMRSADRRRDVPPSRTERCRRVCAAPGQGDSAPSAATDSGIDADHPAPDALEAVSEVWKGVVIQVAGKSGCEPESRATHSGNRGRDTFRRRCLRRSQGRSEVPYTIPESVAKARFDLSWSGAEAPSGHRRHTGRQAIHRAKRRRSRPAARRGWPHGARGAGGDPFRRGDLGIGSQRFPGPGG
jgi:hypothetical protein